MNAAAQLGKTPLVAAAEEGHISVVSALLEAHAEVDIEDDEGATAAVTALWAAAKAGHAAVITALLEAGADFQAHRTLEGTTPLQLAAQGDSDHNEAVAILLTAGASDR